MVTCFTDFRSTIHSIFTSQEKEEEEEDEKDDEEKDGKHFRQTGHEAINRLTIF